MTKHIAPSIYTYANFVGFYRSVVKANPSMKKQMTAILCSIREDLEKMNEIDAVKLAITGLRNTYGDVLVNQYMMEN